MDVSVTELRANLAAFLDQVQGGEEITITDRGEPIARIVPAGWARRFKELEDAGVISMPTAPKRRISDDRPPRLLGPGPWSVNDIRDEWR
ncbi:MAG: type II toxin-antitoxin system Phd/YefM family antitoxin [Ilumatobacteraceae bacterium]